MAGIELTAEERERRATLPAAARRALEEADASKAAEAEKADRPPEKGGPSGAEPTRFGDWERNGRAVDF